MFTKNWKSVTIAATVIVAVALVVAMSGSAFAAFAVWTPGTGNGNFASGGNWDTGLDPSTDDWANIIWNGNSGDITVAVNSDISIRKVYMEINNQRTLTINQTAGAFSANYPVASEIPQVAIGRGGDGTNIWNLSGGSVDTPNTYIAGWVSNTATGYLNMTGGAWNCTSGLYVGQMGTGYLNLSGGSMTTLTMAIASNAGSKGTVAMSGGTLTVTDPTLITVGSGTGLFGFTGGEITLTGNQVGFDAARAWFTPTAAAGYQYVETYAAGSNTTLLHFVPVPEPSTIVMVLCGALGLIAYAWRKRK